MYWGPTAEWEARMYGSILLPVDGSAFGEAALPAAVALARRSVARLHIVHVKGSGAAAWAGLPGLPWGEAHDSAARAYLETLTDRTASDLGESVSFALLDPPVPEALRDYAASKNVDIIVMSTHGRGGLSRAWLGSVAAGTVRVAPCPVLLVRPQRGRGRPGRTLRIRRILIPLDGSAHSESIVPHAAALGKATGASFDLIHVIEPVFRIGDSMGVPTYQAETQANDAREARAREYLQNVAERLRTQGVEVDIAVAKGEAVERIGARASETGADLIALATHGRTGLSRLVLGSVADKIVRGSKLPVLLVRPPSEEAGTS